MSIYQRIANTQYAHYGYRTTVCILTIDNGFRIVGSADCEGSEPEQLEAAEGLALEDALARLEPIFNFLRLEESR